MWPEMASFQLRGVRHSGAGIINFSASTLKNDSKYLQTYLCSVFRNVNAPN